MGVKVEAAFSDATPVWTCQCGVRCFGDSVRDAFDAWWKHVYDKHPEEI